MLFLKVETYPFHTSNFLFPPSVWGIPLFSQKFWNETAILYVVELYDQI